MIAIAFLFVCVLCDCFKSRRRARRAPRGLRESEWAEMLIWRKS
jgi:hypothetical protein